MFHIIYCILSHVDDIRNSNQYDRIMYQELMQKLGLDIKFSDCTVQGKSYGPYEGLCTSMKDLKELIDSDINYEIVSDEIYDGKLVKDMTDSATHITAKNYHKDDLEKVADACINLDKRSVGNYIHY